MKCYYCGKETDGRYRMAGSKDNAPKFDYVDAVIICREMPDLSMEPAEECPVCDSKDNDFSVINHTTENSGIEISINRQGMLRVRYYPKIDGERYHYVFETQDIINLKYCPICGRKFGN